MALIDRWARLRRQRVPRPDAPPIIERDWDYVDSRIGHYTRYLRATAAVRRGEFPASTVIAAPFPASRWSLYFIFVPDGRLSASHLYTMDKLRAGGAKLLVIMASRQRDDALERLLRDRSDALIWKALTGYDFSGFALGIREIARASPGASLFIMNDSVLGPLGELEELLRQARWDLTGITASSRIENHLQSYAFYLKSVDALTIEALSPAISVDFAYNRYVDVIYCQETQLARVAARRLSVGAFWYTHHAQGDPTLYSALPLIEQGYPFVKRKLLTEHRHLHDQSELLRLLRRFGHP